MGQQQVLLLALCICVIGIACSVHIINTQSGAEANRKVLISDLNQLAEQAQEYYRRPFEEYGGDGSFLGLTKGVAGIRALNVSFPDSHGEFFVSKSGTVTSVQFFAVGYERGIDPTMPVRVRMTVWADSTAVSILN